MATYEVIIIGSGFSGICAAIKLKENNIHNYLILERDEELGGTWWRNNYPGAAVDVPSHLYSFSFEPYNWTRFFAKQSEILSYTNNIIQKYQLKEKARTKVSIKALHFDESEGLWQVMLENKETLTAKFIISGTGSLSQVNIPKIKGAENFKGASFHTAKWDHNFNYKDKRVAVIGTGASAVQLIPELVKEAKFVHILQRTAHWILPRKDRTLSRFEQSILKLKFFNKLFRGITYLKNESRAIFFTKIPSLAKLVKLEGLRHIKQQIKDEELRKIVTPDFDIGCKRILLTNNYYPSLENEHVAFELESIQEITTEGIRFKNNKEIKVDLIVYATGFHAAEHAIPFEIYGRSKRSLKDYWKEGAFAYYGTTVHNFPNLFFAMGPNTGTGHTSVIYFIESQMNYILDALQQSKANNWKYFEIKEEVQNLFNNNIQQQLKRSIWSVGNCNSWYLTATGKNTTMYPNFSFVFRWHTRKFKEEIHNFQY